MGLYCSHCGKENDSAARTCMKCGESVGHIQDVVDLADAPKSSSDHMTSIVIAVICALYLVFPTFGLFELIPDAIPIVGSLDEAAATTGLWMALSRLGFNPFKK